MRRNSAGPVHGGRRAVRTRHGQRRRILGVSNRFRSLVIVWLLLLATLWATEPYLMALWSSASAPRTVTPAGDLAAGEKATIALFKSVSPSVVHVFART